MNKAFDLGEKGRRTGLMIANWFKRQSSKGISLVETEKKIIGEMVKLRIMFYWPHTVNTDSSEIIYKWTDERTKELYEKYKELLTLIRLRALKTEVQDMIASQGLISGKADDYMQRFKDLHKLALQN